MQGIGFLQEWARRPRGGVIELRGWRATGDQLAECRALFYQEPVRIDHHPPGALLTKARNRGTGRERGHRVSASRTGHQIPIAFGVEREDRGARGHDGSRAFGQPAARLPGAADRLSRLTRPTADQNGGAGEGGERPAPPPCPPPEGEGNGPRQEGEGNVWQRYG